MKYIVATGLLGGLLLITTTAGAIEGDPTKGQAITDAFCSACHGEGGTSSLSVNPNLAGQLPEYLYKQLRDFKSGARSDPIMSAMVAPMSDDNMRNLAVYFAEQKPRLRPNYSPRDAALINTGLRIYRGDNSAVGATTCASCHAADGAGIRERYPRLTGQSLDYLESQLKAFRGGNRSNDDLGLMRAIASRLTDRDIAAVANYIASLGTAVKQSEAVGNEIPSNGKQVYHRSCSVCHSTGIARAPKVGDQKDWKPRIAQGIPTLYGHAIKGFRAMPAKGGDLSLSDTEVKAAVDYLASEARGPRTTR